ncbi:protein embryo defective 514 [Quercus suber]|uniref:Protein embryo defective 514 n=1 Tax=Quercus suber TaxID=58331 RepID=A0AAW0LQ18_QUESU
MDLDTSSDHPKVDNDNDNNNNEAVDSSLSTKRPREEEEEEEKEKPQNQDNNNGDDVVLNKKQKVEEEEKSLEEERLEKLAGGGGEEQEQEKEEEEEKSGQTSLGPKDFGSSVEMFDYFYKFLHFWPPNLNVNKYPVPQQRSNRERVMKVSCGVGARADKSGLIQMLLSLGASDDVVDGSSSFKSPNTGSMMNAFQL